MYYRGTRTKNPMSDWGHAMFVDNIDKAYFSEKIDDFEGHNFGWIYDGTKSVSIEILKEEIITKWDEDRENEFNDLSFTVGSHLYDVPGEEIAELYDPKRIVDSADAWDAPETLMWIWERILEPSDIMAVTTFDGAIVFERNLIKEHKR